MRRALDEVRGGGSRVLAVLGEAGIGKSALLAAIAARAAPLLVAAGRAAEHERDLPFALALDALDGTSRPRSRRGLYALAAEFGGRTRARPTGRADAPTRRGPTPPSASASTACSGR